MTYYYGRRIGFIHLHNILGSWDISVVRGVRGQRRVPALRRAHVRGLQRLLQAHGAEERQVRVSGRQKLPGGQTEAEPLPVLPLPKVPHRGHGQGGGEDGQPQGAAGPPPHQASEPAGSDLYPARPHHRSSPRPHGLHAETGKSGLQSGQSWPPC